MLCIVYSLQDVEKGSCTIGWGSRMTDRAIPLSSGKPRLREEPEKPPLQVLSGAEPRQDQTSEMSVCLSVNSC